MITQKSINELSYNIVGAAIEVHKEIGPGLIESVYEKCLSYLLKEKGYKVERQIAVPVFFRGIYLDCDLRLDLLVNDLVIIELKAVEKMNPLFQAQLLPSEIA